MISGKCIVHDISGKWIVNYKPINKVRQYEVAREMATFGETVAAAVEREADFAKHAGAEVEVAAVQIDQKSEAHWLRLPRGILCFRRETIGRLPRQIVFSNGQNEQDIVHKVCLDYKNAADRGKGSYRD